MKKRIILIVFLVLLIGVGSLVYFGQHNVQLAELYYSGTIEATQADLSFQINGRVTRVWRDEGEAVKEGQILAELDLPITDIVGAVPLDLALVGPLEDWVDQRPAALRNELPERKAGESAVGEEPRAGRWEVDDGLVRRF